MRNLHELDLFRITTPDILERFGGYGDGKAGAFFVMPPGPEIVRLKVIASSDAGWDHVSVSISGSLKTPSWAQMDWVKRQFFLPNEVVMQIHPAENDHISIHPGTLHLWRPLNDKIPLPPKVLV